MKNSFQELKLNIILINLSENRHNIRIILYNYIKLTFFLILQFTI